ncbi:MAG: hypothetical protein CVU09_10575 [Bacteroidetes bacterium HGW-Bacteroidetes-4]|jgi:hypothetical protein|nr:MAG: hypothetical protein CVU09_10575 [Bacteroidetes bacterium HGW-Bacteroidetes-4]
MTIHADIDKIFKEGLADYSQKPPAFVWDNIEHTLNKKRIRMRRNLFYSLAASVALLISFGAGYLLTAFHTEQGVLVQHVKDEEPGLQNSEKEQVPALVVEPEQLKEAAVPNGIKMNEPVKSSVLPVLKPVKTTDVSVEPKKTESNIKKASTGGTLLPPMFSSGAEYSAYSPVEESKVNTEPIAMDGTSDLATLQAIPAIESRLIQPKADSRVLKYSLQSLAVYNDDYLIQNKKNENPWAVSLNASPLLSYRSVGESNADYVYAAEVTSNYEQEYKNEKPLMAYSVGVDVSYKMTGRWSVQSGVYYSEIGQRSDNVTVYDFQSFGSSDQSSYQVNTSVGNVRINGNTSELVNSSSSDGLIINIPVYTDGTETFVRSSGVEVDFVQVFSFYEIPMMVRYLLIDRKLSLNLSGGISTNILQGNKAYVIDDNKRQTLDGETETVKSMGYNGLLGFGIEYPLVSRLNFNLQPTFRYALSPMNDAGTVHPYSFGIYTGIKYSF